MSRILRCLLAWLLCVSTAAAVPTVNPKDHGALGNGTANDTAALQQAVDAVAGSGGTLLVPPGVYLIDAKIGLALKSQMTLTLDTGATLRAIPNALDHSRVISVSDVESVNILGGTIEGEREQHQGTTGEWGNGIEIRNSKQIRVEGVTVSSCWGDGLYIGGKSENITISKVTADKNRRQGLSITSASDVVVQESIFRNTQGTAPECGVDLEPNTGETVAKCQILNCQFFANAGGGLQVGPSNADRGKAFVTGFVAAGNLFSGNGTSEPPNYTVQIVNCDGAVVRNNRLTGNIGIGIGVLDSTETTVTGNTVQRTRLTSNRSDAGILLGKETGTVCKDNIVTGNDGYGIFLWKSESVVSENTVTGNKKGQVKR